MNSGPKLLSAILVIAAAVAGIYFLTDSEGNNPTPPRGDLPTIEDRTDPAPRNSGDARGAQRDPTIGERTESTVRSETDTNDNPDFDPGQGVEGVIVGPRGGAVADAEVFVFADFSQDLAKQLFAQSSGAVRRPIGSARTDENGSFKIGLQEMKPTDRYELWVTSEVFADLSRPGIVLYPGKYFDMGRVQLGIGVAVSGTVTDQRSGAAIAGATVQLIPPSFGLQPAAVPGRELTTSYRLQNQNNSTLSGLEVTTDGNGFFRITNAPVGAARLVAFADSYARQEKQNVILKEGEAPNIAFELSPGMELGGIVVNEGNEPVVDAKITAIALSNVRGGQAETLTGEDGRFLLRGLEEGPYNLIVAAPGFMRPENLPPIEAGTLDEVIQLESKGTVLVQVIDQSTRRRINDYALMIRTYFPQQDQVGQALGNQAINVRARDHENGYYQVRDVEPGRQYKLEIRTAGYAMTFSEPFEVVRGGSEPTIVVPMSRGGSLEAQILTPTGEPLRGAVVTTKPNNHQEVAGVPWLEALRVWDVSRASATSSAAGGIRLERLTPGTYQLEIKHPDYSEVKISDIEVFEGENTELGGIELVQGTLMSGVAYVNGQPAPQVKITVAKAPDAEDQPPFTAITHTDAEGNFVLGKRLPPGTYQVQAMRTGGGPQAIFQHLGDLKQTERQFTVRFGQAEHNEVFRIE